VFLLRLVQGGGLRRPAHRGLKAAGGASIQVFPAKVHLGREAHGFWCNIADEALYIGGARPAVTLPGGPAEVVPGVPMAKMAVARWKRGCRPALQE